VCARSLDSPRESGDEAPPANGYYDGVRAWAGAVNLGIAERRIDVDSDRIEVRDVEIGAQPALYRRARGHEARLGPQVNQPGLEAVWDHAALHVR
jgi:hypothetical protein